MYKTETLAVNSIHHQAVRASGRRFSVSAKAPDGVIEAIESSEFKPFIGVQWHPEVSGDPALVRGLIAAAAEWSASRDGLSKGPQP